MPVPQVQVVGLRSLVRDLQRLGAPAGPLLKAMAKAGRTAAEPVASATRSELPQVSGTLARDVRVTATRTGAGVRMGRSTVRYAGWVEFGGHRKTPHDSFRDYNPRGRYLFPAAVQLAARAGDLYSEAVAQAIRDYPWTNETSQGESVHD